MRKYDYVLKEGKNFQKINYHICPNNTPIICRQNPTEYMAQGHIGSEVHLRPLFRVEFKVFA
jgi:hypothetical protein